jgi:hypothetical protein
MLFFVTLEDDEGYLWDAPEVFESASEVADYFKNVRSVKGYEYFVYRGGCVHNFDHLKPVAEDTP